MEVLIALILTPIVIILGIIILIALCSFLNNKFGLKVAGISILIIIILLFTTHFNNNINKSNQRKDAYDQYRNSTGKNYMTDYETQKAMEEEAKFRYEIKRRLE